MRPFADVCCDWMTGRHVYVEPVQARDSGRVLKISADGEIEYEAQSWEQIRCPSSDTSLRVKCDGTALRFMANIGRFQEPDNRQGLTVIECVEKWREVLKNLGYDVKGFGSRWREGTVAECGTFLSRIDLAGNFEVSDYAAFSQSCMVRRIGQKLPNAGKYGPTWGYDAKRANWWKAKIYDKAAELEGKRRSTGGATLARFEVQLGGEYLKQNNLDSVKSWGGDMSNVVYGRFAEQVFRDSVDVIDWAVLPARHRPWAVLWRDGVDLRTVMSKSAFYRSRAALMEYGIDIGVPCNVLSLARHTRVIEIRPVSALRVAA